VQYPSLRRTQVRHIDLVAVGENRVLCVLILGTGVVEQQVAWLPAAQVTEAWVSGLHERIAGPVVGCELDAAVAALRQLAETVEQWAQPAEIELVLQVLGVVVAQLQANRSEKVAIAGAANLSRPGDFVGTLPAMLEAIEEQVTLLKLFGELASEGPDVHASIGRENEHYGLQEASFIATRYSGEGEGSSGIGVLGPLRMDYASNIAAVRAVARYLDDVLGET
ncbi:MAG: heat-inducible transcriptional repressor HrcA, partial [Leucobacter sp.]|nr:heat-inducible transcriptional repressor HrcA [Leucobacter sp.]